MRKQAYSLDTLIRSATLLLAAGLALASRLPAQTVKIDPPPAPVAGESWLKHLQRSFDETSMGKTGQLGPPTAVPAVEFARWQQGLSPESGNANVTLHGSDLYRMNCRGCHGADGQGAPPEINSVINPVRATSAAAVMERMKTAGMDMNRADAVKMAILALEAKLPSGTGIVALLHDELVIETVTSIAEEILTLAKQKMEEWAGLLFKDVPMLVEGKIVDSWE